MGIRYFNSIIDIFMSKLYSPVFTPMKRKTNKTINFILPKRKYSADIVFRKNRNTAFTIGRPKTINIKMFRRKTKLNVSATFHIYAVICFWKSFSHGG